MPGIFTQSLRARSKKKDLSLYSLVKTSKIKGTFQATKEAGEMNTMIVVMVALTPCSDEEQIRMSC